MQKMHVLTHTAISALYYSNFDQSLRSRNPDWGVRDLEAVIKEAKACGLEIYDKIEMPANNLSVIYVKT